MNQLSLIKFFSSALIIFFHSFLFVNSYSNNFTITDTMNVLSYDKKYQYEDAYYLFLNSKIILNDRLQRIGYNKGKIRIIEQESNITSTIHSKIKINTKNGIDKYGYFFLNKDEKSHLKNIEAKTIKPDGSVINLDSSQIFSNPLEYTGEENIKYNQLRFAIPGVEAGDIIELTYTIIEDNFKLRSQFASVFLFSEIPVISSTYSITVPSNYKIIYKLYNDFPEPFIEQTDTSIYCAFRMDNIKGVQPHRYSCFACELPYFYYSITYNKDNKLTSWKDVYNIDYKVATNAITFDPEKSSYYYKWKSNLLKSVKDSSKIYKIKILLDDIRDNINIKITDETEQNKSLGFYLIKGYIDPINIRRLYRQILDDLGIEYWAVFARNKWMGPIDSYFIRKNEVTDLFFLMKDDQGSCIYLYPHDLTYKYEMNEIPIYLYNTQAVIVKPAFKKPLRRKSMMPNYSLFTYDSVIISQIKLPAGNPNSNYFKHMIFCDADLSAKNNSFKSEFTISGGILTKYRSFFSFLRNNEEINQLYQALIDYQDISPAFNVDTITKREFINKSHFRYKVNAAGKLTRGITYLNDSLISISLGDIILHDQIDCEEDSIDLNYILDYAYTDVLQVFFTFSKSIDIINMNNFRKQIKNEIGEYSCNINILNNKSFCIGSKYSIFKDIISKSDYNLLINIDKLIQEAKNSHLILKVK